MVIVIVFHLRHDLDHRGADAFLLRLHVHLLLLVLLTDTRLDRRSLRNPVNPLEQVRELRHILLGESAELPSLDPGPSADVGNTVLALALASQVFARLAAVLAGQVDFEHTVDAEGLVAEALDSVRKLLLGELAEVVQLALVRSPAACNSAHQLLKVGRTGGEFTVPEEQPLQRLTAIQLILEAKDVILVVLLEQIQKLRRSLVDGEGRALGVVDDDWDAAIGIQTKEPVLLLLVGHDVDQSSGPGGAVDEGKLLEEDLDLLAIGGALSDEMKPLGILDIRRSVVAVEVRHVESYTLAALLIELR